MACHGMWYGVAWRGVARRGVSCCVVSCAAAGRGFVVAWCCVAWHGKPRRGTAWHSVSSGLHYVPLRAVTCWVYSVAHSEVDWSWSVVAWRGSGHGVAWIGMARHGGARREVGWQHGITVLYIAVRVHEPRRVRVCA